MKPLRIGFLLPHYGQPNKSHMPVVMRALQEWGVVTDVIQLSGRAIDVSTVRVEHDLYVLKHTSGLALSLAGALHAQGAVIVNPYQGIPDVPLLLAQYFYAAVQRVARAQPLVETAALMKAGRWTEKADTRGVSE